MAESGSGIDLEQGVLVNAFCTDDLPGSPQRIHLFQSVAGMAAYRQRAAVDDALDHSYVWREGDDIRVTWANRAGPIRFCGSAAFALVWMLRQSCARDHSVLKAPDMTLTGSASATGIALLVPAWGSRETALSFVGLAVFASDTGIFFVEVASEAELVDDRFVDSVKSGLSSEDVHGLCIFHWHDADNAGALRYFVPRYGRDEDYVTGSVHAYLAPLINARYDAAVQHWRQLSPTPGALNSQVQGRRVVLRGECRFAPSDDSSAQQAHISYWWG